MSTSRNTSLGVLIPFWVITLGAIILVLLSTVGSFSTYAYLKDETFITENVEYSYNYQAYLAWGIIHVIMSILTLLANICSIVTLAHGRALLPAYLLFSNIISFVVWAVLLILAFVVPPGSADFFQLIGNSLLIFTSMGQLSYGAVLFHRIRRRHRTVGKMLADEDLVQLNDRGGAKVCERAGLPRDDMQKYTEGL